KQRLHDIADARIEIEEVALSSPAVTVHPTRPIPWVFPGIAAGILLSVVIAYLVTGRRAVQSPLEMRFEIRTPQGERALALSPDGRYLVYAADTEGKHQLWLRPLNSLAAPRLLQNTENVFGVFWSPDSRSIAFFADEQLKRFDLSDEHVRTI